MTRRASPSGGANAPRLPAESAAAGLNFGHGGHHGEHRLDALADEERRVGPSEADGVTEDAPRAPSSDGATPALVGERGVEPGALHAEHRAVVAGHGGDQRRQPAHRRAFAIAKLGVEAQAGEPAAREPPRLEVAFGVRAVDGAATPPKAARRLGRVVGVALARGRRSRQGEEGASLVERRAQRRRARAMADDVEQVAVLARCGIGELAGRAGGA